MSHSALCVNGMFLHSSMTMSCDKSNTGRKYITKLQERFLLTVKMMDRWFLPFFSQRSFIAFVVDQWFNIKIGNTVLVASIWLSNIRVNEWDWGVPKLIILNAHRGSSGLVNPECRGTHGHTEKFRLWLNRKKVWDSLLQSDKIVNECCTDTPFQSISIVPPLAAIFTCTKRNTWLSL